MLLFAVAAVDKVKTLPPETWLKVGIALGALILAVVILRKLANTNKFVAGIVAFIVGTVVFFSWIYNRNEPKFLTPVVEYIAPFFPSAKNVKTPPKPAPRP